jgi:hypothetical protein
MAVAAIRGRPVSSPGENGYTRNITPACRSRTAGTNDSPPAKPASAAPKTRAGTFTPLGHEISVDRMSYKDTNAKQTQNRCDRFHHFDAPCFTIGTSNSRSWFRAGFIGSGKWFRRIFRFTQARSRAALTIHANGRGRSHHHPSNPGRTSGLPRVVQRLSGAWRGLRSAPWACD